MLITKKISKKFIQHLKSKNFSQSKTNIINPIKSSDKKDSIFTKAEIEEKNQSQENKLGTFYKFMEENIKNSELKNTTEFPNSLPNDHSGQDDIFDLLKVIKCPITESSLEQCDEGLKISHIIYPKRNGIYILTEEEAQFKF